MAQRQKRHRLSARERAILQRTKDHLKTIRDAAARLDEDTLTDLIIRARYTATDPATPPTGGKGNTVANPTAAAVVAAAGGRITHDDTGEEVCTPDTWAASHLADPIRDAIADVFNLLPKAAGTLATVDRRHRYVTTITDPTVAATPGGVGNCQCCTYLATGTPTDRLRSGYCNQCFEAWRYQGYPDRVVFQKAHHAKHPNGPAGTAQPDHATEGAH